MNFIAFKNAVAKQFADMVKRNKELFYVETDRDVVWTTYLEAFPEGSNPIYRKRTEHDCSCCRSFIRQVGNVVAIENNQIVSIWDVVLKDEPAYAVVAAAMSKYIKTLPVAGVFRTAEPKFGIDRNFEQLANGEQQAHNHFYITTPKQFIMLKDRIGPHKSTSQGNFDVFYRGMTELTVDAIETVSELITQGSLYRGSENKTSLQSYLKLKKQFDKLPEAERVPFAWVSSTDPATQGVARLRNTAIGQLLIDLSAGRELEAAVGAYESMVAPQNYRRPTALVTKSMIENARKQVEELGLLSAFQRRFANLSDISINDLIYADRNTRSIVGGNMFEELAASAKTTPKDYSKVADVPIAQFLAEYVPTASSIELLFETRHQNNLVSLITAEDPTAKPIFKWDNQFSWSYAGEVADAIKERVKTAGGNVTGDVCCRLAWYNFDDLDLHMYEPSGYEIYFGNRHTSSPNGGKLDVDMNAGGGSTRTPVENIVYSNKKKMMPGTYKLVVHQYNRRETAGTGFTVNIDIQGQLYEFNVSDNGPSGRDHEVATLTVSKTGEITVNGAKAISNSKECWNITTNQFHKVSAITLSPNHWGDSEVGNKHYFFLLEGCENDDSARGFYNEFLRGDLNAHRKVFEMLAGKNKPAVVPNQLSGLGFSSTIPTKVTARVTGKTARVVNVVF